ncbi:MAG: ATP-binding protein [Caldimicrobium sp.]|nr:ATP-binding protein [Caldimicrobium sp.]
MQGENKSHSILSLIEYWQILEALSFQTIRVNDKRDIIRLITEQVNSERKLKDDLKTWGLLGKNNNQKLTFRCGFINVYGFTKLLEFILEKPQRLIERPDLRATSCLLELQVDKDLLVDPNSIVLSLAPWVYGKILSGFSLEQIRVNKIDLRGLFDLGIKFIREMPSSPIFVRLFFVFLLKEFDSLGLDELLEEFMGANFPGWENEEDEALKELKNEFLKEIKGSVSPSNTGFLEFDLISRALRKALKLEKSYLKKIGQCIDYEWIKALVSLIRGLFGLKDENLQYAYEKVKREYGLEPPKEDEYGFCYVKIYDIKGDLDKFWVGRVTEDSMLNSFFIEDLNRVKEGWSKGKGGKALEAYLKGFSGKRIDVRTKEGLDYALESLEPRYFPEGCWPSEPDRAPSFSQQLAINEIWKRFNVDGQWERGIFSVNGPPGTGKTTLLRDLVSAIIVERAKYLCENNPFEEKASVKFKDIYAYKLDEKIKEFIIVVASSNNTAVENVSLELPKEEAIGKSFMEEAESTNYFKEAISKYLEGKLGSSKSKIKEDEEEEADEEIQSTQEQRRGWGLVAVALGRSENRQTFMRTALTQIEDDLSKSSLDFECVNKYFLKLLEEENNLRKEIAEFVGKMKTIEKLQEEQREIREKINGIKNQIKSISNRVEHIEEEIRTLAEELNRLEELEKLILKRKPKWLDIIFSFGRKWKEWRKDYDECINRQEEVFKKQSDKQREKKNCEEECKRLERDRENLLERIKTIEGECEKIQREIDLFKQKYNIKEVRKSQDERERELTSPWHIDEWRKLRAKIFLCALKLHKAFLVRNKDRIIKNLELVEKWLAGEVVAREASEPALMTLSLIVPVISTTFASVGRMLKKIGAESIGWLLIDEAGQALPHHAVGAIYRARRVVVVGDPKQLEPVATLSSGFIDAISEYYNIQTIYEELYSPSKEVEKVIWRPDEGSCQVLADYANNVGTYLGKDWVGCPLRVHRRCLKPMFDIANEVAYKGMMIYGLEGKDRSLKLPYPCWIDVKGRTFEEHWCEEEGKILVQLLEKLQKSGVNGSQIFILTPFRSIETKLRSKDFMKQLRDANITIAIERNRVGTVHKAQGKEAEVVIFLLGGNPNREGALRWASVKPNLLNVAVSRAKEYLYVIGNYDRWKGYKYFETLAKSIHKVGAGNLMNHFLRDNFAEAPKNSL